MKPRTGAAGHGHKEHREEPHGTAVLRRRGGPDERRQFKPGPHDGDPVALGSVRNRRSLLYVGNLADAIATCLDHPAAAGKTYLVADGDEVSTQGTDPLAVDTDGDGMADGWEVIDRRFSGSEILLELRSTDGHQLWVEAGSRVRHLGLGDAVMVRLRDVETVAFGRHADDCYPFGASGANVQPAWPLDRSAL